jgi:hypothetical protein
MTAKLDGHVALLFGVPRSDLFSWDSGNILDGNASGQARLMGYVGGDVVFSDDTFRQKISVCCFSCSVDFR